MVLFYILVLCARNDNHCILEDNKEESGFLPTLKSRIQIRSRKRTSLTFFISRVDRNKDYKSLLTRIYFARGFGVKFLVLVRDESQCSFDSICIFFFSNFLDFHRCNGVTGGTEGSCVGLTEGRGSD